LLRGVSSFFCNACGVFLLPVMFDCGPPYILTPFPYPSTCLFFCPLFTLALCPPWERSARPPFARTVFILSLSVSDQVFPPLCITPGDIGCQHFGYRGKSMAPPVQAAPVQLPILTDAVVAPVFHFLGLSNAGTTATSGSDALVYCAGVGPFPLPPPPKLLCLHSSLVVQSKKLGTGRSLCIVIEYKTFTSICSRWRDSLPCIYGVSFLPTFPWGKVLLNATVCPSPYVLSFPFASPCPRPVEVRYLPFSAPPLAGTGIPIPLGDFPASTGPRIPSCVLTHPPSFFIPSLLLPRAPDGRPC